MRPLEIMIPVLLAVHLLWRGPRPVWIRLLPAFALIVVFLHLIIEGYRWQMIPIYLLTVLLAVRELVRRNFTSDIKPLASILLVIALAISTSLPIVLPVPSIPDSNGPYEVGTRLYELTDSSRKELYSGKDEARRFQIQVWYPSEPGPSDQQAGWMNHADVFTKSISTGILGFPPFFLDHLALVKIPA